jgi:hypothetical protein
MYQNMKIGNWLPSKQQANGSPSANYLTLWFQKIPFWFGQNLKSYSTLLNPVPISTFRLADHLIPDADTGIALTTRYSLKHRRRIKSKIMSSIDRNSPVCSPLNFQRFAQLGTFCFVTIQKVH